MEANELMDYFERKSGSKGWPSDDPKDSPYDTFICKLPDCGWSFKERMYGNFPIDHDPMQPVKKRIVEHLAVRHNIAIPLRMD